MSWVYLIGENGNSGTYKIGSTRCKDINKRLKQLQTGNSNSLFIKDSYETSEPFKLEHFLHAKFKNSIVNGEWFELSKEVTDNFSDICLRAENIISSLKNNPFY